MYRLVPRPSPTDPRRFVMYEQEGRWCVGCGVLIDARLVFCSEACGDAYFQNAPQIKALETVGLTDGGGWCSFAGRCTRATCSSWRKSAHDDRGAFRP